MEVATLEIVLRTDRARRGAKGLRKDLDDIDRSAGRGRRGLRDFGRSAERATATAAGGFRGLRRAILGVTAALAAVGIGVGLAQLVGTLRDVEFTLAGVRAVTGATAQEFAALSATARELGATTIFAASEAAEGLRLLGLAGFTAQEAISGIGGTLNLAAAGAIGLGDASRIAANVIRSFRLEATQAGEVADVLAATATNANTTVLGLGDAFSFIGPVAAAANQSVADTAASLGVLADAGFDASRAGTGLRRVFAEILQESDKLVDRLPSLGLTVEDINLQTNDLATVLENLSPLASDAGFALETFGQRGGPAFLALVSQIDRIKALNEVTRESGGTAEEIADILTDTLAGSLKLLRSAIEEAVLTLGDAGLTGALRGTADTITGVIRALTGNLDPLDENVERFESLAESVKTFGSFVAGVSFVVLVAGLKAATAATFAFTAALLANPLGKLALIAGLAVAAIFSLRDEVFQFGETTFRVGDVVAVVFERFKAFGKQVSLIFQFLIDDAAEAGEAIESDFTVAVGSALKVLLDLADKAVVGLKLLGAVLSGTFDPAELLRIAREKPITDFFAEIGAEAGERFKASFTAEAKIDELDLGDTEAAAASTGNLADELENIAKVGSDAADVISGLTEEQFLLTATNERELEVLQNLAAAKLADADATSGLVVLIRDLTRANADLRRQQGLLFEIQERSRTGVEREAELVEDLTRLLDDELITREQFNVALGTGILNIRRFNEEVEREKILARGAAEGLSDFEQGLLQASTQIGLTSANVRQLGEDAALSIGEGLTAALRRPKDAGDILLGTLAKIGDAIIDLAVQEILLRPLLDTISGIGSGGVTTGGTGSGTGIAQTVVKGIGALASAFGGGFGGFSKGGISQSPPTVHRAPLSLLSEARRFQFGGTTGDSIPALLSRDEAVVPLSGGRAIPVEMREGEEGTRPVQINFNISTPDAESFRRNQGQLLAAAAQQLSRAQARNN